MLHFRVHWGSAQSQWVKLIVMFHNSTIVYSIWCFPTTTCPVLDIKVLGWLPEPKCFGCPWYNFSCPDIMQTAEIPLDRHMLVFAYEESNCIGKKLGLAFFVPINFVSRIVLRKLSNKKPQRLSLMPLPTENNSHGIKSAKFCLPAERTDPSRKRSIKFSVGLPQSAYAFVSDMSVPRNTSQSQARQTCTQARQTNHKSLVAIFLLPTPQNLSSRDLEWGITRLWTNQRPKCKIGKPKRKKKKKHRHKKNGLHFKTRPPTLGLGRVIKSTERQTVLVGPLVLKLKMRQVTAKYPSVVVGLMWNLSHFISKELNSHLLLFIYLFNRNMKWKLMTCCLHSLLRSL